MKFLKNLVRRIKRNWCLGMMIYYSNKMLETIKSESEWYYWQSKHSYWTNKFYNVM